MVGGLGGLVGWWGWRGRREGCLPGCLPGWLPGWLRGSAPRQAASTGPPRCPLLLAPAACTALTPSFLSACPAPARLPACPPAEGRFDSYLDQAARELLAEGVQRLVEDANRLEPLFLNLAGGQE